MAEQLRSGLQNRVGGCNSHRCLHVTIRYGRVAELVDALDSKSCELLLVRVQVPPRPPGNVPMVSAVGSELVVKAEVRRYRGMIKAVGMGGQYDRAKTKEILNRILDFIDHGDITDIHDETYHGHPCLYLLHTADEVQDELDVCLTKDKYSRYDICYIARKLIKFCLGKYDIKTTVKLTPRDMTMPAGIKIQDGKPYIVDVSSDLKRFLGWQIVTINRVPVEDLMADIEEVTAYATPEWLRYKQETTLVSPMLAALPHFKGGMGMMRYGVTNGGVKDEICTSIPNEYTICGFQAGHGRSKNYSYRVIDDVIVIQYSMCRDRHRLKRLIADAGRDAKKHSINKFVIDLRHNSGGSPDLTEELMDFVGDAKLVTLTNGSIYSCGAMACARLRNAGSYTIGTDIGMSLDGFVGSQKIIMDDVGLSVSRSVGNYCQWNDKKNEYTYISADEFKQKFNKDNLPKLHYFHPDEYVYRTVEDLVAGRDPQLDAAIAHLNNQA